NAAHLKHDKDLNALRERADFAKLVTMLEAPQGSPRLDTESKRSTQMNPSTRAQVLRETDQSKEHPEHPRGDTVPHGLRSMEQNLPRGPGESSHPDKGIFEAFVGGTGI